MSLFELAVVAKICNQDQSLMQRCVRDMAKVEDVPVPMAKTTHPIVGDESTKMMATKRFQCYLPYLPYTSGSAMKRRRRRW